MGVSSPRFDVPTCAEHNGGVDGARLRGGQNDHLFLMEKIAIKIRRLWHAVGGHKRLTPDLTRICLYGKKTSKLSII